MKKILLMAVAGLMLVACGPKTDGDGRVLGPKSEQVENTEKTISFYGFTLGKPFDYEKWAYADSVEQFASRENGKGVELTMFTLKGKEMMVSVKSANLVPYNITIEHKGGKGPLYDYMVANFDKDEARSVPAKDKDGVDFLFWVYKNAEVQYGLVGTGSDVSESVTAFTPMLQNASKVKESADAADYVGDSKAQKFFDEKAKKDSIAGKKGAQPEKK